MKKNALALVALVATVVLAGCLGGREAGTLEPPAVPAATGVEQIDWSAEVSGPLAASFTVRPVAEGTVDCKIRMEYEDVSAEGAHWSGLMVREGPGGPSFLLLGSKWHAAQAHFIDMLDTRPYVAQIGSNQRIEAEWEDAGIAGGTRYTFVFGALEPTGSEAQPAVVLKVACLGAVLDNVSAGRDAVFFDTSTMHRGLGVSVDAPLPFVGAGAALMESVHVGTKHAAGRVVLIGLDILAAQVDIHHPTGQERFEYTASPDAAWPFYAFDGWGGDYEVVVTQVATGGDGLGGAVLGLDPLPGAVLPDWSFAPEDGSPCDHEERALGRKC